MSLTVWVLAIAIVLVIEGVGPLLFPFRYQKYLAELTKVNPNVFQRIGGSLVTAGVVLLLLFS